MELHDDQAHMYADVPEHVYREHVVRQGEYELGECETCVACEAVATKQQRKEQGWKFVTTDLDGTPHWLCGECQMDDDDRNAMRYA